MSICVGEARDDSPSPPGAQRLWSKGSWRKTSPSGPELQAQSEDLQADVSQERLEHEAQDAEDKSTSWKQVRGPTETAASPGSCSLDQPLYP